MNFPPRSLAARRSGGFTLIELLVVIAIIGVLAGLLFSVFGKAAINARKMQVVSDMRNTKVAVVAFYTDYRKYPLNDVQYNAATVDYGGGTFDTVYGDPGGLYTSADLFNILRAQADGRFNPDNKLNPNKTVYWEGQPVKNASKPSGGITTADYNAGTYVIPKGAFVDPWGHEYILWFDADRNGDMSVAAHWFYTDVSQADGTVHPGDPPLGFIWASMGPDGKFGTKGDGKLKGSDDIVSWQ